MNGMNGRSEVGRPISRSIRDILQSPLSGQMDAQLSGVVLREADEGTWDPIYARVQWPIMIRALGEGGLRHEY
jgi:hypothetical protein